MGTSTRESGPGVPEGPAIAIVLAGQRRGVVNPLAERAGVSHKCLAPIAGRPLIAHVLAALTAVPAIGEIRISIEAGAEPDLLPVLAPFEAVGPRIRFVASEPRLADSLLAASFGDPGPFIVTTADNVLLTPEAVIQVRAALDSADGVAAMARKASVLAAHPDGQRNFYRFRDDEYANCNIYALANRKAIEAGAHVFRGGGQFMKSVWRMISAFGLHNILLLRLGAFTREAAMRRLSRRLGLVVQAIEFSDGSLAVDVDNERTYRVCEELLAKRDALAKS
jgi:GTP:adenosylcobinamide-phosphate guanylyltransferase